MKWAFTNWSNLCNCKIIYIHVYTSSLEYRTKWRSTTMINIIVTYIQFLASVGTLLTVCLPMNELCSNTGAGPDRKWLLCVGCLEKRKFVLPIALLSCHSTTFQFLLDYIAVNKIKISSSCLPVSKILSIYCL